MDISQKTRYHIPMPMQSITIPLVKKTKTRLQRLAFSYGLSLADFSRKALEGLAENMPVESLEEYDNPRALRQSLGRALQDYRNGRVSKTL